MFCKKINYLYNVLFVWFRWLCVIMKKLVIFFGKKYYIFNYEDIFGFYIEGIM